MTLPLTLAALVLTLGSGASAQDASKIEAAPPHLPLEGGYALDFMTFA